jgi:integrase
VLPPKLLQIAVWHGATAMANDDDPADEIPEATDKGRGKRNVHTGIIDLRYGKDGDRTDYKGSRPYKATCHFTDDNGKSYYVTRRFSKLKDAVSWYQEKHRAHQNRDNPAYYQRTVVEKRRRYKVADVINYSISKNKDYMDAGDIRQSALNMAQLGAVTVSWIGKQSVFDNKPEHWKKYFREIEGEVYGKEQGWSEENYRPRTAATVSRIRGMIKRAFDAVIDDDPWECMAGMTNPVKGHRIGNTLNKRHRRLLPGEEAALFDHWGDLRGSNKYYVPLAFFVLIETGMRRSELVRTEKKSGVWSPGLKWSDVLPLADRRIRIREEKNDKKLRGKKRPGRTTVMSVDVMLYLDELHNALNLGNQLPNGLAIPPGVPKPKDDPDSQIFRNMNGKPMTGIALSAAFSDTVGRAELKPDDLGELIDLHDLRREANHRFTTIGLEEVEREIMLGHVDTKINATYQDAVKEPILMKIQDQLDRATLYRFKLDRDGKPVRNDYGEEIKIPMNLTEYLSHGQGRRVSNQEALNDQGGPLHNGDIYTRWERAQVEARRRAAMSRRVYVIQANDLKGVALEGRKSLGHMSLLEAAKVTKADPFELMNIDHGNEGTGTLSANGYLFISEAWAVEHSAVFKALVKKLPEKLINIPNVPKLPTQDNSVIPHRVDSMP